jgi:glyoxylase-like metal-dependent hydrolase (beta-lactamase superfamily II)
MRQITPDIFMLEGLRVANVYLLTQPEGLSLVDCGITGEAGKIASQITKAGYAIADLRQVIITHAHNDHTGSLVEIIRLSGAKVVAHQDEVPYLARTAKISPGSRLQRFLFWLSAKLMPGPTAVAVDIALKDGEIVPDTGGFMAVHTPGHTPGSLCLYHPERHILICGDAIINKHPLTGKKGLRESVATFSVNPAQMRESIRKLAGLDVEMLLTGHGEPILGNASALIKALRY